MTATEHTLQIFERLVQTLPPLVPEDLRDDALHAYEQAQDNMSLSEEELEDTMIAFAKRLWPYREAFLEFMRVSESHMGETFLLRHLDYPMKQKYHQFIQRGNTFRDFHVGKDLSFFTSEEKGVLCTALVQVQDDLWKFTEQHVAGVAESSYLAHIAEFKTVMADIEVRIQNLQDMADKEQEHPELAAEIRAHAKGFEHSISLLGPKLDYEAVCHAEGHFEMRRETKEYRKRAIPSM